MNRPQIIGLQETPTQVDGAEHLAIELLHTVWRIRLIEERIAELYPEQEMRCPVHLSIGQEGVAVGICAALEKQDKAMSGHRAHAHYLAKGGDLKSMLAEIYGKETGCCRGRGGSMHLIDLSANFIGSTPIVGGTIPVALGVAWSSAMQQDNAITVIFMGEGAAEEGVWHETLNFASLHRLPLLFACENNLYSVYTHVRDRQPDRSLTNLAAAHGLATYEGDGNDVLQVYSQAQAAVQRVRSGEGPAFMHFTTYRWREHCGPNYDNDLGYRSESEFLEWKEKDPLDRLITYTREQKFIDETGLRGMKQQITGEIDEAVSFAKSSPFPVQSDLNVADVYARSSYGK